MWKLALGMAAVALFILCDIYALVMALMAGMGYSFPATGQSLIPFVIGVLLSVILGVTAGTIWLVQYIKAT